jgi:hypothetical protein
MKLSLLDRTGSVKVSEYIKVENGRSAGQFILPSNLATDEYLLHIGFPKESVDQFLFRGKIKIYNRSEVLSQTENTPVSFEPNLLQSNDESNILTAQFAKNSFRTKQKIEVDLTLNAGKMASLSVLVQPIQTHKSKHVFSEKQDYEMQNLRKHKTLDFQLSWDHPYLLLDLKPEGNLKPEARPFIFIPETHQVKAFYKTSKDSFSMDVTNVSGGIKSFYFNQFIYKPFIPATANWDYEKEKYKEDLVPYFEGEMKFSWIEPTLNFSSVIADIDFNEPTITAEVIKSGYQQSILEAMLASGGYDGIPVTQNIEEENPMTSPSLFYKNASDYELMDNMAEFLFEIVTGIRVWDNENKKDIRVMLAGEMYQDSPLFLIDGFPTRDVEKVLALPIEDIEGAGVIKYQESRALGDYDDEARLYNAFASSGIIVIHLKPGESNPFKSSYDSLLKKQLFIEAEPYPNPRYTDNTVSSETPDLRKILLWQPIYEMNSSKQVLSFYSSDVAGTYELLIQGISDKGQKVFLRKKFTISSDLE